MAKKTALFDCHQQSNAKLVDFAGWEMPLHYGSQIKEHLAVRSSVGIFDVSHMTVLDLEGHHSAAYLKHLLANNVDKLKLDKALYTCMLNEDGGVIDDLIVYKTSEDSFRLIVNSATREKDLAWLNAHMGDRAITLVHRQDLSMIAIQGPDAAFILQKIFPDGAVNNLPFFSCVLHDAFFIARTGYTGEDGYEIIASHTEIVALWQQCITLGVAPCGLGARDTLRLEAGLNLYGLDMDESVTPLESNLAWTIAWQPEDRQFIGRQSLEAKKAAGLNAQLVGLTLEGPGVLRSHQKVKMNDGLMGEVTSGTFSPTLSKGIALARIPITKDNQCFVEIRGRDVLANIIKLPFVKKVKVN